jgi:hypothetical protein
MSDKFHVNPETGNPNKCTAKKACPFGGDDKHYFSKEAAHEAFEKEQGQQIASVSKPSKILKDLPPLARNLPPLADGRSFAQAWTDRFEDLNEFKRKNNNASPRTLIPSEDTLLDAPVNAIRDRGMSLISATQYEAEEENGVFSEGIQGDYVVAIYTRQGGGNRECWCDDYDNHEDYCLSANNEELTNHPNYLSDSDDDFDSTYATFYFDAGIKKNQVDDFQDRVSAMRRLASDEAILEATKNGDCTPWGALAGGSAKMSQYTSAKQRIEYYSKGAKEAELSNAKIESGIKKVYAGTITEQDAADMGVNIHRRVMLVRESKALIAAQKKLDAVLEIQKSAEDLPEGHPLREWAIGAREERSYQTTEKKGRRNVTVTKRYTPKPRLMDDVESEQRGVDNAKRSIDSSLSDVLKKKEINEKTIESHKKEVESLTELRSAAWEEGWYADPRLIPEIPKDF